MNFQISRLVDSETGHVYFRIYPIGDFYNTIFFVKEQDLTDLLNQLNDIGKNILHPGTS